ncbi:MAG: TIGR03792 family protein [Cyanobacteria bacterium P01_A01_bin.17]
MLKLNKSFIILSSVSLWLTMAFSIARPVSGEQKAGADDFQVVQSTSRQSSDSSIAVEWLRIKVDPARRQEYLQKDAEIWTPALKRYPGFIDKTVWLNPDNKAEIIIVVRWASREQWFSIPEADLEAIQAQFDQAFPFKHRIKEVKEYQAL